jgi:hypothetical protein
MTLTFDPGVNPSFVLPVEHDYPVDEQGAIKPYVQTIPLGLRAQRTIVADWKGLTRDQVDYFLSFFHEIRGPAGNFFWTPPDSVASPLHRGPDLAQVVASGAPGARTYFVKFTWYNSSSGQETKASPVSSISLLAGRVVQVTAPIFPAGVDRMRVYAGTVEGTEWLQVASASRTWTEPITGLLTLTSLAPAANNLRPAILWRLVGSLTPEKASANRYNMKTQFQEMFV